MGPFLPQAKTDPRFPSSRKEVAAQGFLALREQAVRILTQVLSRGESLDEAFDSIFKAPLGFESSAQARAHLLEWTSGVLRWKGRLDTILDTLCIKKKVSGWLRKALYVSTYQLLLQERTPLAWIVSESVDWVRKKEGPAPARFVNALLRKVAEQRELWLAQPYRGGWPLVKAASWASLPPWLWQTLFEHFGESWACAFALSALERPRLWGVSKVAGDFPVGASPGQLQNSWWIGHLADTEEAQAGFFQGLETGRWMVQDISSQRLLSELAECVLLDSTTKGMRALDLCAAPGGKSRGLLRLGFQVVSTDFKKDRFQSMQRSLAKLAPEVQCSPWEDLCSPQVLKLPPTFDLVWVDAPCSGSGIIRRHPDVRWLRKKDQLKELCQVQRECLDLGWQHVKPGGFLMYSVCSVLPEEGSELFASLATSFGSPFLGAKKMREWSLLPHEPPFGDGFWAVLMQKPFL